jgi:hypothetical protein
MADHPIPLIQLQLPGPRLPHCFCHPHSLHWKERACVERKISLTVPNNSAMDISPKESVVRNKKGFLQATEKEKHSSEDTNSRLRSDLCVVSSSEIQ